MILSNSILKQLFELLKSALWKTFPNGELFKDNSDTDWEEIIQLSTEQGVMAIAYDGMLHLPVELQPSRKIKLAWALKVDAIEKRYANQLKTAEELAELFYSNNISMLLFKGIALARDYPIPEHREFGDLDIYLFNKHEQGDNTLSFHGGIKKNKFHFKHTSFFYKGISVENHMHLLATHIYPNFLPLEEKLLIELSKDYDKIEISCKEDKILFPSPEFHALFLITHIIAHFSLSIALRSLCDWAIFLYKNKNKVDFKSLRQSLSEAGILPLADAITALTVRYLNLPLESAPFFEENLLLEDSILEDSLNLFFFLKNSSNPSYGEIIAYKCKRLKYKHQKYKLINPYKSHYKTLESILYHIRYPHTIFKLKK